MSRGQRNLLLLAGIVLLAALGWFTREQAEPEVALTALDQNSITHIRIEHPGQPAIALLRGGDGEWALTEPVQAAADAFEVTALLNLATLPVRRVLDAGFDAAELGLAPPGYAITLNDTALRFGDTNPITAQRVLQTDALTALVDNPPSAALDADYSDLVSKQLIPEGEKVAAIELPDGRRVEPASDGDGWRVTGFPALDPQALVEGWEGVRAMWNGAAPDADTTALEQVTVHLASGATLLFAVVQRAPQFELINPALKLRYTLSAVLADTLLTVPEAAEPEVATKPGQTD